MDGQYIIQMYQQFQQKRKSRQKIRIELDTSFQAQLDIMQYLILSIFQKNAKNLYKQKKNRLCDRTFKRGFKELTDLEKIYYYKTFIQFLQKIVATDFQSPMKQTGSIKSQGFSKTYSKIGWKQVNLKIDFDKKYLYIERQHKMKAYDLNFYLMRRSKATQYNTIVLQAINDIVNEKGYQIHIGFKDVKIFRQWYDHIKKVIEYLIWERIKGIVYPSSILTHIESKITMQNNQEEKENKIRSHEFLEENDQFDNPKLYQSTYVTASQKFMEFQNEKLSQSTSKKISGSQSQKSHQKSCHSIEIKPHSPRSSIKSTEICVQLERQQNQQGQSFRSFGQLNNDDIQNQNDQLVVFERILPNYQLQFISSIYPQSDQQVYNSESNQTKQGSNASRDVLKIYSNKQNCKKIKTAISLHLPSLPFNFQTFCSNFTIPQFYKSLNTQVQQLNVKTVLSSDNCVIMYQKNKCYNRLYRSRDFVFIRHQFQKGGRTYIVDKSVQDSTIPPFTTIVRGEMTIVYEIYLEQQQKNIVINIDATVQNLGYLKDLQEVNINLKYFKGFQNISQRIIKFDNKIISPILEANWPKSKLKSHDKINSNENLQQENNGNTQKQNINNNDDKKQASSHNVIAEHILIKKTKIQTNQNQLNQVYKEQKNNQVIHQKAQSLEFKSAPSTGQTQIKKKSPKKSSSLIKSQQQKNYNENEKPQVSQPIIKEQMLQTQQDMQMQGQISFSDNQYKKCVYVPSKIDRKFDQQTGSVLINYACIKRRQITSPDPKDSKQFVFLKHKSNILDQNPTWKGNWEFLEEGGMKFINKKQIQDQKGVLKFILSQVAKNLVSGKSILNISLPVDIFSSESNLEKFIYSMTYAPYILQSATKASSVDRFIKSVVFGMTLSPLYLQMQKPFNPILGQTFQCYINGCPAYAQQISHHPPIAAFLLYGRGYRVSAQIQSKMKLNINSGTGVNEGVYRIRYDDNDQEVCYISPSGEVTGLAYGDRKFNMIGKAYAWSQKSQLFLEITFNPKKGGYFGKQQHPIDYYQGKILKVKQQFLKHFIDKKYTPTPKKSDILQQIGKFHGRWNKQLKYQDRTLLIYNKQFPLQIQYEEFPLASDANWRQDITYRRMLQITSAQMWKEKLEVQQRNQRKLREKYQKERKK